MDVSTQLDPFHLVGLSEDIDLQCQRLIARELPKAVDEKALFNLKVALREQMVSLFTEMLNEWNHLAQDTGEPGIFDQNWIIPGVREMAAQLPQIYGPPLEGKEKEWHIDRVRWTIGAWMHMWGQLFAYLPSAEQSSEPLERNKFPASDVEPSLSRVPKASHILAVTRIWQMLRVLTLEYLSRKAELLVALGKLDVSVDINDDVPDVLSQAKEAFWSKRADAPLLLVLSLRGVLLQQLNVRDRLRGCPFHLPTPALVGVAANAGLEFPHPVQLIGNLCFDLEATQNLGDSLEFSYLYPVFRVLCDTVEHLQKAPTNPAIQARAAMIVAQIAQQNSPHEDHPQDQ